MATGATQEAPMGDNFMDLPPGFRFHPTDEEIITHYLREKVMNNIFNSIAIGEADLNRCEPWDLPSKFPMKHSLLYHSSFAIFLSNRRP